MISPQKFISQLHMFEKRIQPPLIQDAFDEMQAVMERESMTAHVMNGGVICTAFLNYGVHSMSHYPFSYSDCLYDIDAEHYQLALKHFNGNSPFGVAIQYEMIGPGIGGNDLQLESVEARATASFDLLTNQIMPIAPMEILAASMGMPVTRKAYNIDPGCYLGIQDLVDMTASQSHPSGMPIQGLIFRTQDCKKAFRVLNPVYNLLG